MGAPSDRDLLARALEALCEARRSRGDEGTRFLASLDMVRMVRAMGLQAPILFARPDMSCVSVVTLTPKHRGWYQRTCFTKGCGATASDDLHTNVEEAVCRAWMLGYTLLVDRECLSDYMPKA